MKHKCLDWKTMTVSERNAVSRFYRNKEHFRIEKDQPTPKLFYQNKEVLKESDLRRMIVKSYHDLKGVGYRTLYYRLQQSYSGVSKKFVRSTLGKIPHYRQKNIKFNNKAPMKHVTSRVVHETLQVDLVDFSRQKVLLNNKVYKYVLSVLDVFSRHVWLRPLKNKSAKTVSTVLKKILEEYGVPKIIQHDRGKEFEGAFNRLLKKNQIRCIKSRPYHPQSQGKIERIHRTLKGKIRFDLTRSFKKGINWAKQLSKYQHILNTTPRQCLAWKTPMQVYFGRCANNTETVQKIRDGAIAATRKLNSYTDNRQERQLKTPVFEIHDTVYFQCNRRGKLSKQRVNFGKIAMRNVKQHIYKVKYFQENKAKLTNWIHISNLTAGKGNEANIHRKKYYIVKTVKDHLNVLESDFGFQVGYNPPGDGNCQFEAIVHQLANLGLYRSHLTLRSEIVAYLRTHSYLGQQEHGTSTPWDNHILQTRAEYLRTMSENGEYGDHITLQCIAEIFNVQILVVSSLGVNQNTLVTPSGEPRFSEHLPTLLIGHYPENNGEHFVSLEHDQELVRDVIQNSPQIVWIEEKTLESRAMTNNNNHNSNEQNYSNHQVDQEIVDVASNNNQDVQVLPNEMFEVIIRVALQQDPLSRFQLQLVNQFFKHVVEKVKTTKALPRSRSVW